MIQAHLRGYLFRTRRKNLLAKLDCKNEEADDFFEDLLPEGDFDPEAFFGIKEESLETKGIGGIDDDLMEKAIEIMTAY